MRSHVVLRVVTKFVIPFILLFALYVQFHGEYGPGGGFQAGVLFGAAVILYGLIFGLDAALEAIPHRALKGLAALGVLIFLGTGLAAMALGGNLLDYSALGAEPRSAQHLGILLVELGVGITVAASMILIFTTIAGRGREPSDG